MGNGVNTSFPFAFKTFQATDLQLTQTSVLGVDTAVTSLYSVSLNTDQEASPGGTITYPTSGSPMATGVVLTVTSTLAETQLTDLTNAGGFFPKTITDRFDYLTILIQQHSEKLARVALGSTSDVSPNFSIGTALQRANKYLTFDSSGNIALATSLPSATLSLATISAFTGAQTPAEASASVTPTNLAYPPGDARRYGSDPTGAVSSAAAFNAAAKCGAPGYVAPGTYLLSGTDAIVIPANGSLSCAPGTAKINITANAGSIAVGSAAFTLAANTVCSGFVLNYPNQTLSDLVGSIIQYPPTFTLGIQARVSDIYCTGSYIGFSEQASFAEIFIDRVVFSNTLFRGLDFSGAAVSMGDTSRASNAQFIMCGSAGFNGGPVDVWCRANAIGVNSAPQGSNRIDEFELSNFGVIGGSCGFKLGLNSWFVGSNLTADICTQSILTTTSSTQFYVANLICNVEDNIVGTRNMPAIRNSGTLQISGAKIGLQAASAQNAIFNDAGTLDISNVAFSTSRGGFAPAIFNVIGTVKASGCTIASTASAVTPRPLAWGDVVVGSTGGTATATPSFSIDGKSSPIGSAGNLSGSLANFNMNAWAGNIPTNWTTGLSAGQYTTYFQDLFALDGVHGIDVGGVASGAFSLSYVLPQGIDDLFGLWLVSFGLKIIDPGSAPANAMTISMSDGSGVNAYTNNLTWSGAALEPLGIPVGAYYNCAILLASPTGTAPGKFNFNFNFLTATNLHYRIQSPQLFGMTVPPECSGPEYWNAQSGGRIRDIVAGPNYSLFRAAAPVGGAWRLGDRVYNNASPAAGTSEWRCTAAGSPGTWTGLTIP